MKARTKTKNGYIFFVYEDYYGTRYGSYDEAVEKGDGTLYLVGYFHSNYWNGSEAIDELELNGRPTIGQVKEFIKGCKEFIEQE